VPGAQWLAVEPQQSAPRTDPRRHDASRPRTTPKSPPPISRRRWRKGKDLGEALKAALDDLDGFFTFVVGTKNGFGVVRDPIACKPAVMAETDQYVAFGSEYRALVNLPGIEDAQGLGARAGHRLFLGALRMHSTNLATSPLHQANYAPKTFRSVEDPLREFNQALHNVKDANESNWEVLNPRAAIPLPSAIEPRSRSMCRALSATIVAA
jgi:hypothetical protein